MNAVPEPGKESHWTRSLLTSGDMVVIMLFAFGFAQIYGAWKYR